MPKVSLHGVALDSLLARESFRREPPVAIGEVRPAFNGGLRDDVGARKERWTGATRWLSQDLAAGVRGLVEATTAAGWTFDDGAYSAQGDIPLFTQDVSVSGGILQLMTPSGAFEVAQPGARWTVLAHVDWQHWIVRSDGLAWTDGVAGAGPGWLYTAGGTLYLCTPGISDVEVDELVVLPFLLPSAWVAQVYAEHSVRSLASWHAPRLAGTLIPGGAVTVRGQVMGTKSMKTAGGILEQVEFRLEER